MCPINKSEVYPCIILLVWLNYLLKQGLKLRFGSFTNVEFRLFTQVERWVWIWNANYTGCGVFIESIARAWRRKVYQALPFFCAFTSIEGFDRTFICIYHTFLTHYLLHCHSNSLNPAFHISLKLIKIVILNRCMNQHPEKYEFKKNHDAKKIYFTYNSVRQIIKKISFQSEIIYLCEVR